MWTEVVTLSMTTTAERQRYATAGQELIIEFASGDGLSAMQVIIADSVQNALRVLQEDSDIPNK